MTRRPHLTWQSIHRVWQHAYPAGWFSPLHPRPITAFILLAFGLVLHIRPALSHLYTTYSAFDDVLPNESWVTWLTVTALLAVFSPRGTLAQLFAQFNAAILNLLIAGVFSQGIGLDTGSTTYTTLAAVNLLLFGKTMRFWLERKQWFKHLATRPPQWFMKITAHPRQQEQPRG